MSTVMFCLLWIGSKPLKKKDPVLCVVFEPGREHRPVSNSEYHKGSGNLSSPPPPPKRVGLPSRLPVTFWSSLSQSAVTVLRCSGCPGWPKGAWRVRKSMIQGGIDTLLLFEHYDRFYLSMWALTLLKMSRNKFLKFLKKNQPISLLLIEREV